ncbi:MAG: 50S ribosomal protein L24 [Candidatus Omnitrophica bacterium]|nr:50S ribosomal protein L24 [Candidatus Omnitrophota bacterium]
MFRVKRNDQVMVISGKDRGKKGKVLTLFPENSRATVEGLNIVKRHLKKSQANPQGAILSKEAPLPLDRILPVCPRCNRGVRVGFKLLPDGAKTRICRRCQETF